MVDYTDLEPFATPRQREYITAIKEHGSNRKAASALGVHHSAVSRSMDSLKKKAARQGYSPNHDMTHPAPDGFHLKGASTLYKDGEPVLQWVKTNIDRERQEELFVAFAQELADDVRGKGHIAPAPKSTEADLLTLYPLGDPHIGMYSWCEETGQDFDLDIATADLTKAVARLVESSPKSKIGLILNLGDFWHSDNQDNRTARSGNSLDVDTRWAKVLRAGKDALISCIDRAQEKHEKVIVKNLIGNHDDHSSQFLSLMLDSYYHDNDRVVIDTSPARFWYHQFGCVLFGATHGDTVKHTALPEIMAADVPELWGDTEYRYWHTGHVHHDASKEFRGCMWESHRTLAGKDAWHTEQGYRSGQSLKAITYHKDYGEEERHTVDIKHVRPR